MSYLRLILKKKVEVNSCTKLMEDLIGRQWLYWAYACLCVSLQLPYLAFQSKKQIITMIMLTSRDINRTDY